jgi:hypothetical protein
MSEIQYTPGPWMVGKEIDSGSRMVYIRIESSKSHISSTGVYGSKAPKYDDGKPTIPVEEARANARLISAAPNLLEACKLVIEQFCPIQSGWSTKTKEAFAAMEQAIAKAEGRQEVRT